MTTYTAEDFANAEAARHPETGRVAVRVDRGQWTLPWAVSARPNGCESHVWLSDQNLAEQGWEPAYVSRNPQKMRRHISDLEAVVKRRGEDIERLESEKAELREQVAQTTAQPIDLDALRDAWENAEQADERNEGDVLIFRHQDSSTERVQVWRSVTTGPMTPYVRILHRAPKPKRPEGAEQLEALLDEWGDLTRGEEPTPLADWLAARGVRVTEGELL